MNLITMRLSTPEQAHKALANIVWPRIKAELQAGHEQALSIEPFEDSLTTKQRGYYHGVVLTEIAAQVVIEGKKHSMAVWKEYIRDKFLGYKRVTFTNPLTGRKSRRRVRISTEDLGVKRYAKLIDEVTAYAITELNVRFPAGSWETWEAA
jgi:hypothetical protein